MIIKFVRNGKRTSYDTQEEVLLRVPINHKFKGKKCDKRKQTLHIATITCQKRIKR